MTARNRQNSTRPGVPYAERAVTARRYHQPGVTIELCSGRNSDCGEGKTTRRGEYLTNVLLSENVCGFVARLSGQAVIVPPTEPTG